MGTYVPPLPLQNFIPTKTTVKAVWLNAMDNLLQGHIPADGEYNAGFVEGQVQVTGPSGLLTSYGDLTFGLLVPNPSGIPSPVMTIGGAGKLRACITTDAKLQGLTGIQ